MCSFEDRRGIQDPPGIVLGGEAWHKAITGFGCRERQGRKHEGTSRMSVAA